MYFQKSIDLFLKKDIVFIFNNLCKSSIYNIHVKPKTCFYYKFEYQSDRKEVSFYI